MPSQKWLRKSSLVRNPNSKIVSQSLIKKIAAKIRARGKKIAFTNGTFDLLHLGHVTYLQASRQQGDVLIVGVNTDRSVKSYKGPTRPVNPEKDRLRVLAALECIDYVVLFDQPTPLELICKIRPHVLVKGADWTKEKIVGAQEAESWGGKVKRIRLVPNRSTTRLIQKLDLL